MTHNNYIKIESIFIILI